MPYPVTSKWPSVWGKPRDDDTVVVLVVVLVVVVVEPGVEMVAIHMMSASGVGNSPRELTVPGAHNEK